MYIQGKDKRRAGPAERINIGGKEDRLSALPNALVCLILSFLPFESAVTTASLSRRWQHLWTQLPSLIIYKDFLNSSSTSYEFWNKFNIIISKLTLPLSRTLSLNLCFDFKHADAPSFTDAWFRRICGPNMEEIRVTSPGCASLYTFVAPSTYIFQMQSLVRLDLGGGIFAWNLPSNTEAIDLPNLKQLRINVICSQFGLLGKLVSSISSLEELAFWVVCGLGYYCCITENDRNVDLISLACPNLKELYAFLFSNSNAEVIVDAPKLQYLKVTSNFSRFAFVGRPTMLVKADLYDWGNTSSSSCDITLFDVLESVSNARSLVLRLRALGPSTLYPNLTKLTLKIASSKDIKWLLVLLESCPALEKLRLDLSAYNAMDNGWTSLHFTPGSLLTHVKTIKLDLCSLLCDGPLDLVKYLLSGAQALERLSIKFIGGLLLWERGKHKELQILEELLNCQKKLLECQIEYSSPGSVSLLSCKGSKLLEQLNGRTIP